MTHTAISLQIAITWIGVLSLTMPATAQTARQPQPSEDMQRMLIVQQTGMQRLNGRLEDLERAAADYRNNRRRTNSGVWKLTVFYSGMGPLLPTEEGGQFEAVRRKAWDMHGINWLKQYPKSPTPYIAKAVELMTQGWRRRGGGFASEVWPDDMDAFGKKMDAALNVLELSRHISAVDPHWYALRIQIAKARGEGVVKILSLLNEAVEKEPYYYQTYFEALDALRPEWGGDWQLVERLIDWSVEKTKEADGTSMYARSHWVLYGRPYMTEKFRNDPEFWHRFQPALADLVKRYPTPYNLYIHRATACQVRHEAAVRWTQSEIKRLVGVPATIEPDEPADICQWGTRSPK